MATRTSPTRCLLDSSRPTIGNRASEGNFDVLSLHARGLTNVVAPLGTAFTLEQARLLKRFAPSVVFLFDGDLDAAVINADAAETKAKNAFQDAQRQGFPKDPG